jgi:hypothetical protein
MAINFFAIWLVIAFGGSKIALMAILFALMHNSADGIRKELDLEAISE